ncbi:hypothetical protein ACVW0Q_002507 [Thermostichus sp. MS-CIW-21]|jgi:hypothetical protein|uniref:hypothetical protein n=1 Tax=unclassified Synechococcus TaxID=2626047 RepID=UPI000069486F|nr:MULTISPECIES: hypothetical protein [unclassified Synechococcus]ABD00746.1 hypothetical protein CYA_2632 [Synechococcus sp. JA-3-3Ab]PIK84547.1 hypothetical protein SYN65AY6A5_12020 [Synechococcus sp. 65AY6A5]PIK86447.1 hypothetical protein SYN63AY4M2_08350 [Synechococcus sp. 63AY4M2]PIK91811.1 hypothetical protein SYN65AY6LI_05865 [Synechococcus sp. 65AY6Li]PIK95513.1 hypothetical protein SYN60AY4M2_08985 [Synechococcus sp. 60AY4M2]
MLSFFFSRFNGANSRQSGAHRVLASKATSAQRIPNRMSAPHKVLKQERQMQREQEFAEMEQNISRIHYFYRKADMPLEMRQLLTYRKLMELDYFTPQAAKELIRQWQQQEEREQERRGA